MQADKMKVKKIKVATLTGPLLNLWVARAYGEELLVPELQWDGRYWLKQGDYGSAKPCPDYSTDWSQGGPIIDREEIELVHRNGMDGLTLWAIKDNVIMRGETKLIAAMRAYVVSKFGEEVDEI